jgi:hypothetical protein
MTVFNPPNPSIFDLLKLLTRWKIIIISNNKKIDKNWELLNSSFKITYLSIRKQIKLGYNILKYLNNTCSRKNIGYLYAIQHGAKEIFEMDENVIISDLNNLDIDYKNDKICYGIRNDSSMINPYSFFYKKNINIWPRGFRLRDLGKDFDNKFYVLNPKNLQLKPLIYQGIIDGFPDIDSIFQKTNIYYSTKLEFTYNYPLVYFPGNYIPINSKNTKYFYEIFPFLLLPTTVNERISDILRGYIMQYFAWRYEGCVIYHVSNNFIKENNLQTQFFKEEKKLFFNIDNFIDILNINSNLEFNNPIDLLYKIINDLIQNKLFGENEINVYKAYFQDLSNCGYTFSSNFVKKLEYNKNYVHEYTKFNFYLSSEIISIISNKNNNFIKIVNHYNSINKYSSILLIINYNHKNFDKLNEYISDLYKNSFPNIVFITPSEINTNNIISCNESYYGYYSYICLEKVYLKYPNFKGYLTLNDDDFMKIWELENLNLDIPWLYLFNTLKKEWCFYSGCIDIYQILNTNKTWNLNLMKFQGSFDIPVAKSDLFYIPNYFIAQFCQIV